MIEQRTDDEQRRIPEEQPPFDEHAEMASLGAMFLSEVALEEVINLVQPGDYYLPKHQIICQAILDLAARGEAADPITVGNELAKTGNLVRAGGPSYLHTLVNTVPTAANAEYYAGIVDDKSDLRGVYKALHAGLGQVREGELDATAVVANVEAAFNAVLDGGNDVEDGDIGAGHDAYLDELEEVQQSGPPQGVMTGFADLDALTNGLQPGQMIVVAARPAMGKSVLAADFARNAAGKYKVPTVFFSLEMSDGEIRNRINAAQGGIALHHLRSKGGMTDDDWTKMAQVTEWIRDVPLKIKASASWTVPQIHAECRRIKRRNGLGFVIIDYLQLVLSGQSRPENRQVEVSKMSRGLKLMAKDLGVPVVVLAQLNRGPEQRTDKRPMVSDLRESGAIEQDADMVILLHREDAYEKESPRAGEADLIVAKHRNGPTATITCAFQGHYSRFVDMAQS